MVVAEKTCNRSLRGPVSFLTGHTSFCLTKVAEIIQKIAENIQVSTAIETEIQQLFAESGDAALVAEQLMKRWDANVLSDDDVRSLTRFMIQAELFPQVIAQLRRCLKRDQLVPWSAMVETIHRLDVKLEPAEVDAIFVGVQHQSAAAENDLMLDLVESRGLDNYDPRTREYRVQKVAHIRRARDEKRADLQRQLDYARVNRLLSQEKRLLDEIQAFDPDDAEVSRQQDNFKYREAQEIFENALAHSPPKAEIERKFSQLSPELRKAARPIIARIRELAKAANETQIYDMALMLIFMDLHDEGVKLLDTHRLSTRIDWLLLETLILARQYAAALGEVESLEVKYAGDSESPFALTYARARALWGLGDTITAIELMRSLSRVRPTYRSATTLLQQWMEEAP